MKPRLSDHDRETIKDIYEEVKKIPATLKDLDQIEMLLTKAIGVAEKYGTVQNDLLKGLHETAAQQLSKARSLPARDKGKWQAVADLKLHLIGDLIGWF
ncbi:MAG TPA: hypothetical protein VFZ78_03375 [Flavisolibacter sp.]